MKRLVLDAKIENLEKVMAFLEDALEEAGASAKEKMAVTLSSGSAKISTVFSLSSLQPS